MRKLNVYMLPEDTPITKIRQEIGYDFDTRYEVQNKKVRTSRVKIEDFITHSPAGSVSGGPFADGSSLNISSEFTYNPPYTFTSPFGIPMISIYVGTEAVGSMQIFPRFGAGIANQEYSLHAGWDYASFTGNNFMYRVNIENNSGAPQSFYADVQWKIVEFNTGAFA